MMTEKQSKTLTLLGKISGVATTICGYSEMIPPKFAFVGVIIMIVSSTLKDTIAYLGDFWDDGKINQSFNVPVKQEDVPKSNS
jgi:hypothetical protein